GQRRQDFKRRLISEVPLFHMLGKIIGNYQITSELARGGMGSVYRGRHQNLPREVVVKSILLSSFPQHAQDHLKARFVREAYVQAQLDHQNIVRVYEFFTTPENYYLVMEFVDGMSLRDLIIRQGALPPASAVPLFKQALSALAYAHNFSYVDESGNRHTGIIHRDIKPANMLLGGTGNLKITDFGIVKLAGERSLTKTGFNPGTVEYMSPEQIRGLDVDARSDIYSLGVTFYEMLTGRLPFPPSDTGSEYEVLRGHIELPPPPIATVKPGVPEAIGALVMRSLHKDPGARFQSAAEFLEALIACEQSGFQAAERAAPKPPQVTHSMTEVISYDTREEPSTLPIPAPGVTAPPLQEPPTQREPTLQVTQQPTMQITQRQPTLQITQQQAAQKTNQQQPAQQQPIQQGFETQVGDPAPVNRLAAKPSGQQSRGYGLLIAIALVVLLAVAGSAFVLFKPGGVLSSNNPTPTPAASPDASPDAASPTPAVAQEEPELIKARQAEAEERYQEALFLYGQYQVKHAMDDDPRVREILDHKAELEKFFGLVNMGLFLLNKGDYAEAERNYADALMLRPDSKLAQEGLNKAKSRGRSNY
ncbi:MAG TPA: serine/threonine-protein kinase, partial [Blastocatellia bacterium]